MTEIITVGELTEAPEHPPVGTGIYGIERRARTQLYGDALRWASALTIRRHLAGVVIAHADIVFDFLTAATSKHDLELRGRACRLQHANDISDQTWRPDDDPEAFVQRAGLLYEAMTGAGNAFQTLEAGTCPGCIGRGSGARCCMCGRAIPAELQRPHGQPAYEGDVVDTGCADCQHGRTHTHLPPRAS
ncbi:hypothetical protein [Nonomuraea typhae]|uniref:hypothetical protein n=1 Tax=Nonomuraea typhae TaxID=2603600 RepID=UPI0012FA8248|nr:hypothetical protein [Nonomuraea typhae]